jgi:two-component system nitrogen regulation response regulator GlnG
MVCGLLCRFTMTNPLNAATVTPIDRSSPVLALAGTSFAVQTVNRAIHALSRSEAHVLVCGEAGTGKREWARLIHEQSSRRDGAFVVARLQGMADERAVQRSFGDPRLGGSGLLARARRGTLFLDGLQSASEPLQRTLLSLLTEDNLNGVRLISGADPSLDRLLRVDKFSRALYDHLALIQLHIPPLRERVHDIVVIANEWIAEREAPEGGRRFTLSHGALAALTSYTWPGNVPELLQVLETAVNGARRSTITAERIRAVLGRRPRRRVAPEITPLHQMECDYICAALARCGGNQSMAARRLGIGRSTLIRKLRGCDRLRDQL